MKAGRPPRNSHPVGPLLRGLGISKRQAADWQKLAAIPEADFRRLLQEPAGQDKRGMPNTSRIIAAAHGPRPRTRLASLERIAAELRAAGWAVFPPQVPPAPKAAARKKAAAAKP